MLLGADAVAAPRQRRRPAPAPAASDAGTLLAAVDLGSNSFRLEIGRVATGGDHIEPQGHWKETVRLAAGLDAAGRLQPAAIDRACAALARMNERLRGFPPAQVRAVGTQTLRTASNAAEFLRAAEQALGYPIQVIAGREEARLVFEGCMHALPPSAAPRLVVDIGGASTELIVGRGFDAERAESFRLGCVDTTLRFFGDGVVDRAGFRRAQVAAAAAIEQAVAGFSRTHWDEAYGASGTAGAIAAILRAEGWSEGSITSEGLLRLRQALVAAGEVRRIRLATLKPERQQVIAGGAAVLCAVFEVLGITEMRVARGALRLGLLHDLLGRRAQRDLRDATVERLQQRFDVDRAQAQRVARLARQIHARLVPAAAPEVARRLGWAAALHEVGMAIAHDDHHKHGAYFIEHGDLAGFSTDEQRRLATLVLAQRGSLRKVAAALQDPERLPKVLALRLAVLLCHARREALPARWTVAGAGAAFELGLERDWLAQHPLTAYLLDEERDQWEKVGRRLLLRTG